MTEDRKKFNYMESKLAEINRKISLSKEEKKRNNEILNFLLKLIIDKMKEKNCMFKKMFIDIFYGGSYYDGLKIDKPEEFDLDLLLKLPAHADPTLTISNIPGFVTVHLKNYDNFLKQPESSQEYRKLHKLIDNIHYIDTQKVKSWIEGIVQKTLNDFENMDNKYIINTKKGTFNVTVCKGGPAFTLKVAGNIEGEAIKMDIDLVPCFRFCEKDNWPKDPFKKNSISKKPHFFIVPKAPEVDHARARYWRLSFQEQERELMDGKKSLKPTIKLLKKLRNQLKHNKIASYYIKTFVLWINDEVPKEFWENSQSYVFITILRKYQESIENKKILYYWNKRNNLLNKIHPDTLTNMSNKLKIILEEIERKPRDATVIEKYLLG